MAKFARPPTTLEAALEQNAILRDVSPASRALVVAESGLVQLALRQVIYTPEEPIDEVYFPVTSVLSIVSRMQDGQQIEIGTIGREGMSAFPLLMGASATANDSYCQVAGDAVRMPADAFRRLSATDPIVRQRLDRYLQAYVNMLGQLAACNRLHTIYQRCARWLLLTQDRVGINQFELTHEYLAMMLGTGRSGLTIAASALRRAGLIRYTRGTITILDRAGLEGTTCECYEVAREQFGGLLRTVNGGRS
jgi:CRP-like cAMP-binding protein